MSYPRGSEWQKWDLHVHVPFTKLSNGYGTDSPDDIWAKFCDEIEESEVVAFGITDYFSADQYFTFIEKFTQKYPHSEKKFFPNIELRLNETVNSNLEEVNIHLIFNPNTTKEKIEEFLRALKTESTDDSGRALSCSELSSAESYKAAVVTRSNIQKAFEETFGKKAVRQEHLLVITAANNDGIRPPRGQKRKESITDEIDKASDGYFGGSQNSEYFLNTDRLEDPNLNIKAKPVFSGSDTHSFQQFTDWVGKTVESESNKKEITWIKANPTYDGLLQTLIEPENRVKILPTQPDNKEKYKVIDTITFSGTNDFPSEPIVLNQNLTSVIGSRSSGKSALLAYIAYSIDPEDTVTRQLSSQEGVRQDEIGPAAGIPWSSVTSIRCEVKWLSGSTQSGKVVYIPQNYLYSISNRPDEITQKIEPVLFKKFPGIKSQFDKSAADIESANLTIEDAINQWFDNKAYINRLKKDISDIGSKTEIEKAKNGYQAEIDSLKEKLTITDAEVEAYQALTEEIAQKNTRKSELQSEIATVQQFITPDVQPTTAVNIDASIKFYPSLDSLPLKLSVKIQESITPLSAQAADSVKDTIAKYYDELNEEDSRLVAEIEKIRDDNKDLIDKNRKNAQLANLITDINKQKAKLTVIADKETLIAQKTEILAAQIARIKANISLRDQAFKDLDQEFQNADQSEEEIVFGVEHGFGEDQSQILAEKFNRQYSSNFLEDTDEHYVDIPKVRNSVQGFVEAVESGAQKLKNNQDKRQVIKDVLCATEEVRFSAVLEDDKIGGFGRSSMTPGKRALFALTLILNEADGAWPLLIDQPEDDLDSRSIYEHIVPYIMQRKKERQIIMVSHNANLVVGADSEEVIVANKHGDDRQNRNSQTFDYRTGALEDTLPKHNATFVLDECGIREHACEILDGGEEAFEKRKNKYRL